MQIGGAYPMVHLQHVGLNIAQYLKHMPNVNILFLLQNMYTCIHSAPLVLLTDMFKQTLPSE